MGSSIISVLDEALSSCFGDYKITESFKPLHGLREPFNHVRRGKVFAHGSSKNLVLKTKNPLRQKSTMPTNLRSEAASLRHCESVGIPSPQLFGCDSYGEWVLIGYVAGSPIARLEMDLDRSDIIQKLGTILANIHLCKCKPKNELKGILRSENSRTRLRILENNLHALPESKMTSKIEASLTQLYQAIPTEEELTLIHGDFSGENILLTEKNELCALDWENARFSAPGFDLAFACSWGSGLCRNEEEEDLLLSAYRSQGGSFEGTLKFYRAASYMEQAVNALSNGESIFANLFNSAKTHLETI